MFFGFQTPTSEYAQALVDFHHYAFFFLITVTIFVMWMIKLSLLFVMREKKLVYRQEYFYLDTNNKWFGVNGEFFYLVRRFQDFLWNLLGSQIQNFLTTNYMYLTFYRNLFYSYVSNSFGLENSFFGSLFNIRNINTSSLYEISLPKARTLSRESTWVFYSQHLVNLAMADINKFNYNLNSLSNIMNSRTLDFFRQMELSLFGRKSSLLEQTNLNLLVSFIPSTVLSTVKQGFFSVRFSHWTWGGKNKNVFLLFTGNGDAYSYPSNEFYAFDENVQMPQALKFFAFYNHDLWRHPFLFFQNVRHRLVLEWVWTFIPTLILLVLVVPSLYLLYSYDKPYVTAPYLTFKAIGHQWYWSYEYWDYTHANGGTVTFDSYMVHEDDLDFGQLRLLEVDRRVVLPAGVCIRLLTTSTDVLHSWAVPAFGVKIDSIPGRLNQFWLVLNKPGVYYGQCSELCGVNHGFMPIAVEVVFLDQYLDFINLNCDWFNN